jgi:uncharacterized protein (UPF0276 family)
MSSNPVLATPVSHLFHDKEHAELITRHSDTLECRDRTFSYSSKNQSLFHCEIQPIHELRDSDFHYIENIKKHKQNLELMTFHLASSCRSPKSVDKMFVLGHNDNYTEEQLLTNAENNFKIIKKILGDHISIAVENNNYYPTEAYKYITEPEFINQVMSDSDLFLLFDIAHAKVTSYNQKIRYETYRDALNLSRAIQVHICEFDVNKEKGLAYDAHNLPSDSEYAEVKFLVDNYKGIKYLTIEFYRDVELLIASLNKFKSLTN